MGPRLDGRGNPILTGLIGGTWRSLQWGHAWMGVGMAELKHFIPQGLRLQWGHAWMGVGMASSAVLMGSSMRLQWGHAWMGVGMTCGCGAVRYTNMLQSPLLPFRVWSGVASGWPPSPSGRAGELVADVFQ